MPKPEITDDERERATNLEHIVAALFARGWPAPYLTGNPAQTTQDFIQSPDEDMAVSLTVRGVDFERTATGFRINGETVTQRQYLRRWREVLRPETAGRPVSSEVRDFLAAPASTDVAPLPAPSSTRAELEESIAAERQAMGASMLQLALLRSSRMCEELAIEEADTEIAELKGRLQDSESESESEDEEPEEPEEPEEVEEVEESPEESPEAPEESPKELPKVKSKEAEEYAASVNSEVE